MSFEEPGERQLTDPRVMRAMAHPLRIQILELLQAVGPMTATQLSERLGESPANCSFHLRTLAKYGFVEEAPGGTGRQRPWQRVPQSVSIKKEDLEPEAHVALEALDRVLRDREAAQIDRWAATRSTYPEVWQRSWFSRMGIARMTADELHELGDKIERLLAPYHERDAAGDAPQDALPIWLSAYGFPVAPERGE
jgi:DNA-binding transcriptional ArsR family regulator